MIEEFLKVIEAIQQYGIAPAIAAILIVVVLALVGFFVARGFTKPIVSDTSKSGLVKKEGVLARWASRSKRKVVDKIDETTTLEAMAFKDKLLRAQITDFLEANKNKDGCAPSRGIYFAYHNSGHFAGGEPMSKMSLRVQALSKNSFYGELEGEGVVRGLLRIDFPMLYEKLLYQGFFYISNIQSIRYEDVRLYSLLSRAGLNAAYIVQVKGKTGRPVGFLLVGFNEVPDDEQAMVVKVNQLAGYLASTLALDTKALDKELHNSQSSSKHYSAGNH